ncbi:aminotransferase class I/II-fold pyridoxal phosphate-dependent enzyme [Aquamicrobium sp. LC103]|uniref:aminotransferase class I/II-fold pyridoxal phosphate-dependent enzyme n=1 Tax=Aquamicrobium sp. LC103 TaxID=1120658 RepID=UPI00063E9B6B|nr:aminotransferase class I/II-fold pyridoxal phosphate-dependent enzyme [Aquamicrobium sp. LC103]TKT75666.1 aminotransferase class I/II-fold pyridoxal phosphate-dependent enzyme [Aquamicrobium sp. LC103]
MVDRRLAEANVELKHHKRNTRSLINHATPHFTTARLEGLMAIYARPLAGRSVELELGQKHSRRIVDFVRCSYLGLDNHPEIIDGAIEAVRKYRALHWSCARTRLNFNLIGELEETLSSLFSARVITYSSVLAANMGALPLLASGHLTNQKKPLIVFDRHAHATLAFHKATIADETEVATIPHNDMSALEELCRTRENVAYICDGVYSMGGSAPIEHLLALQERYGLFLYIDDAHGISLFGKHGEGLARSKMPDRLGERTIVAASLGKGFGASGGMLMLGTRDQEELFRNFAVAHAFSASPNLAAVGAALASARLHGSSKLADLQKLLQDRLELFDSLLATKHEKSLPIRMVTIGDELTTIGAAKAILDNGHYVSAVFFPTVSKGRSGLRICPTASHTVDEIKSLCASIRMILGGGLVPSPQDS